MMTTTEQAARTTPAAPAQLEIVLAAQAEAWIEASQRELAVLELALVETLAEADALEAEVGTSFDPVAYQFVSTRLNRFLDELRMEANTEISTLIAVADDQASRRREIPMNWAPVLAARESTRRVESVAMPTALVRKPAPVAITAAVVSPAVEPECADISGQPERDELNVDLETEFWADAPANGEGRRHLFRVGRAVVFQAVGVLLILTVVLIRIG